MISIALASYEVYHSYGICECFHGKRNNFFIFIPGIICMGHRAFIIRVTVVTILKFIMEY